MALSSPVYLDANVLIGAVVSKHRLYAQASQLIGELLAGQAHMLVSVVTLHESLWAIARISYYDLFNKPSTANFSKKIYNKWLPQLFQRYGHWMSAVPSMLRAWSQAGVALDVVPSQAAAFLDVSDLAPQYMQTYELTPGDATHLALAEKHAATLITADSDFKDVARKAASSNLAVVHLLP